jgi:hypothetical protein
LTKFIENISLRMNLEIPAHELADVQVVVGSGEDRDILSKLRTEATYLVLLVRLKTEARKAAFKARKEEEENADAQLRRNDDGDLLDLA